DMTHLEEVLALHDLRRDPGAGSAAQFAARCRANIVHRGMHHHVFITATVIDVLEHSGWGVINVTARRPYHIAALATHPRDKHMPPATRRAALERSAFA